MKKNLIALLGMAALLSPQPGWAAPIELTLNGTTDYDGWINLSIVGGYTGASFPGTGAWPKTGAWTSYDPGTGAVGAIGSNTAGSGDALLYKVANGSGGGPYPAGGSIYFGGFSAAPNVNDGTLGVVDTTPLSGVQTLAFQVEIGEAFGYDFYNHVLPTLTYTTSSGTFTLAATYSDRISQIYNGDILMPTGYEDIYINTWGVQFDLSEIASPILSYEIDFTGVQHAQLYSLQLDQSTAAYGSSVFPQAVLWTGGAADSNWGTAENWQGGGVPGAGAEVSFAGGSGAVLESSRSVDRLEFSAEGGFTLGSAGGSVLTVGSGGIVASSSAPAAYVINAPIQLSAFDIITVDADNDLTLAGGVTAPGFYKKGDGTLRLEGNNTFTGNAYNRLILLGGQNYIGGTNSYTGVGALELNVKDGVVTLQGGDNHLDGDFTLNLVSTAAYDSTGAVLQSESTGRLVMGDASGKSDQAFAGITSDQTTAFNEGGTSSYSLTASNATITGGNAAVSTLTSDVAEGAAFQYWGNIGGPGVNENNIAFVKQGAGVQALGGTSTYVGDTVIKGGMLRIDSATALSANSNVRLDGGVLGLGAADYSANLGTGAGEIFFDGDGGFAASGGEVDEGNRIARTVTLNGGAALAWGQEGFVGDDHKLILSHVAATNNVELTNAIDLGARLRTVQVDNGGTESGIDGQLGGVLSGSGGLIKTGAGTLRLTADNTYTGVTEVREGVLVLGGFAGAVRGDILLQAGASLNLTNSGYDNGYVGDRVADTATITMNGSILSVMQPNGGDSASYSEGVGAVSLAKGANVISTTRNGIISSTPDSVALIIGALDRQAGATVHFSGSSLGTDVRNQIFLSTAPVLDDGIIGGWATTGTGTGTTATEFVTYNSTYGLTALTSYTAYTAVATDDGAWTSASNIKINASASTTGFTSLLTGNRQINSLNMLGARSGTTGNVLDLGGNTLRVESGGIIVSGGATARTTKINNGTLTAGTGANAPGELIVTATGNADIGAAIADNGSGVSLVKTGSSTLTLTGTSTYTGGTVVNQGILAITGASTGGGSVTVRKSATLTVTGSLTAGGSVVVDGTLGGAGTMSFAPGSVLSGSGTVNLALAVGSGAGVLSTVSPGTGVGALTFGSGQTWAGGGSYVWEIGDADAGAGTGWDLLSITGALDIAAGSADRFTINLVTFTLSSAAGALHDFDGSQNYSWVIASAAGGVTSFDPGKFEIDTTGFANPHDGTFQIANVGNDILLTYTAVPEPGTWGLLVGFGLFVVLARRRWRVG